MAQRTVLTSWQRSALFSLPPRVAELLTAGVAPVGTPKLAGGGAGMAAASRAKEITFRSNVVRIFPNRPALHRLVGALLMEDEWRWPIGATSEQSRCGRSRSQRAPPRPRNC